MQTTTHSPHQHQHALPAGVEVVDPEHDIDAKRTLFWLVVCTLGVFVSGGLLFLLFEYVTHAERARKIDRLPTYERDAQREWEDATLAGRNGGRTIEEAMRRVGGK
jgi:hypothetical protein